MQVIRTQNSQVKSETLDAQPWKKTKNKKTSRVLSWIQKREAAMKGRAASPRAERDQRAEEMNNECEKPRLNREDCL